MSNPILQTSPWGRPDSQENIADGIAFISTPSHGGLWLSKKIYEALPKALQCNPYGGSTFFEEDLEAMIIFYYFELDNLPIDYSIFNDQTYKSVYNFFTTSNQRGKIDLIGGT